MEEQNNNLSAGQYKFIISLLVVLLIIIAGGIAYLYLGDSEEINKISGENVAINVDYSNSLGEFNKYLFGIASPPYYAEKEAPGAADAGFKVAEITCPEYKPGAKNVDFSLFDKQVSSYIDNEIEPKINFPLGPNYPENITEYNDYVKSVLDHLNSNYPGKIKALRFANEPDNRGFWKGTDEEFFKWYAEFEKTVKESYSSLVIDAPGIMMGTKRAENIGELKMYSSSAEEDLSTFSKGFLDYCKQNNVSVDYFSIHGYSFLPYGTYYEDFKLVKEKLKLYSGMSKIYGTPKLANNEWTFMLGNIWSGTYNKDFDTIWGASIVMISFMNMIESGLEMSTKLGGVTNENLNPTSDYSSTKACNDFPLWDCNSEAKPTYYSWKAFNNLYGKTRIKTDGSDHMNLGVMAGKDEESIIIVVSSYDAKTYIPRFNANEKNDRFRQMVEDEFADYVDKFGEPKVYDEFNIEVKNIPDSWKSAKVEIFLVDDTHNLESIKKESVDVKDGKVSIKASADVPSVLMVKVTKA